MINPIQIVRTVLAAMKTMSAAEVQAASQYEYSGVQKTLGQLQAAVTAAKADDDAESRNFWANLITLVPPGKNRSAAAQFLNGLAGDAKAEADAALADVMLICHSRIGIHAGVPARLLGDQATWLAIEKTVRSKVAECEGQKKVEGWDDAAKEQYDLAVTVQVNALVELQGVMASTAQSCYVGALLNRAVFFVVAKAIRNATGAIGSAGGFSLNPHYRRTRRATQALRTLRDEILAASGGEVAAGSANELSGELRNTLSMPNLLEVGGWPSGTDKSGLVPANTGQGVTSDGRDADLGVPK